MRSSALLTTALAAGALAHPLLGLFERALVTEMSYVTTTIYVTPGVAATPAPVSAPIKAQSSEGGSYWGSWRSHKSKSSAVPTSSSAPAPPAETPVTTEAPAAPSTTEAPAAPSTTEAPPAPSTTQAPDSPATSTISLAAPSSSSVSTEGTGSCSYSSKYAQLVVDHHNVHRANHSAPDLKWSQDLADIAKTTAQTCVYAHDVKTGGGGYGQNIAAGVEPKDIGAVITELFYNGEEPKYANFYGMKNPPLDEKTFDGFGHFTQIVWKDTTEVGCYTSDCKALGKTLTGDGITGNVAPFFTVCNYKTPGNYQDQYGQKVGSPMGQATVNKSFKSDSCPSLV